MRIPPLPGPKTLDTKQVAAILVDSLGREGFSAFCDKLDGTKTEEDIRRLCSLYCFPELVIQSIVYHNER